ncbi:hypothetical protein [Streptomyces sp. PanSC19]|uniref:hypothetical protein n=1 Tax=Streptomyces sp. PanSC19 TaxID=1520455 RepID=UPI001C854A18|nr:hypothetical protein [Streptomyces sp. PanSC19]
MRSGRGGGGVAPGQEEEHREAGEELEDGGEDVRRVRGGEVAEAGEGLVPDGAGDPAETVRRQERGGEEPEGPGVAGP